MNRLALAPLLALAVALPLLPAPVQAAATPVASTPESLYFHLFDTFSPFPINTQPPKVSFFQVGGTSFPSYVSQGFAFNTVRGFATSGPVEYDFIEAGRPRFHLEPGIGGAVQLDTSKGATAHLFLDVRDLTGLNNAPNALPSFTFKVTMRAGNTLGSDEVLDAGDLLMQGTLTAHVVDTTGCVPSPDLSDPTNPGIGPPLICQGANAALVGQSLDGTPILVPDAAGVVAFDVPLDLGGTKAIPKTGYNVRIDWWQNPTGVAQEDDQLAEGYVRLVSDATHHPRIDLAVTNPVAIEFIHPEVAAGILLIHTAVMSPWGTYDLDMRNITVTVEGPSKPAKLQQVVSQNTHVHNLHDKPAEVTWLWRYRDEGAALGEYKITLKVSNLAGTATATDSAGFNVEAKRAYGVDESGNEVTNTNASNGAKASPGAGILFAAALMVCAAVARHRLGRKGGAA